MTGFSSKWGVQRDELSSQNVQILVVLQFVVTALVLCLTRPNFVLASSSSSLRVPELSLVRVVCVAAIVVAITYGYPYFIQTRAF